MATGLSLNTRIPNPFRASAEDLVALLNPHRDEPSSPHLMCTTVGGEPAREVELPSPMTPNEQTQEETTDAQAAVTGEAATTLRPVDNRGAEEVDDRGAFLYRLLTFNQAVDTTGPVHPLGWREKLITLIWVHKSRLLGNYSFFQQYIEQCPCRPSSPSARSFALSYSQTLANLRRRATHSGDSIRSRVRRSSSVIVESNPPNNTLRRRSSYRRSMSEPAPIPIGRSVTFTTGTETGYLTEIFRMQPFAAAAYLRTLLLCWAAGIVLQAHGALSFNSPLTTFHEHCAWQWLLAQLVIQCIQLPIRVDLYLKLGRVSQSADSAEASDRIRTLVKAPVWLLSQCLGTLFHIIAAMGPILLYILPMDSPVRRQVTSLCCANLLIFILRTVLTFVIMHSIIESRNAQSKNPRRALSTTGIRRLSRSQYSADLSAATMCSICLSHFDEGDDLVALPCDERHCFHDSCITQWLIKTNSCPLCQRIVPDPASDW